ncbi:hypothetical protein HPB47_013532 [Ixodes persulcatus]|uniref:Uncharacterized protein n=1 Tax=Ixodes persulcatus TaxID=34615 RepID=A0AC60QYK1_IXOPE|nr:hypothetical protein HPB47_013532 [Ixodes persulcatus]
MSDIARCATPSRTDSVTSLPVATPPTCRVLYSTPYLHLRKFDETALEVLLRKMYKRALDLPMNTSNQCLMGLGMVNTFTELQEAHLTNQHTRLSKTPSGRHLLARLHIHHLTLTEDRVRIPEVWRYALHVRPLPANMTRDDHSGRRLARAEALARHYGSKHGIFYVDASGPHHGGWYTAAVVHQNVLKKSSDIFHVLWACRSTPNLVPKPNPTREDWKAALLDCSDLASQKVLVDRARAAAAVDIDGPAHRALDSDQSELSEVLSSSQV